MTPTPTNRTATLLGSWLLLEGIWGLFSPVVLGFITTNRLRAVIHILLGLIGIWAAFTHGSRKYLWAFGVIVTGVGVLYFIPAGRPLTDLLAVNRAAAVINTALGLTALGCAAKCSEHVRPLRR